MNRRSFLRKLVPTGPFEVAFPDEQEESVPPSFILRPVLSPKACLAYQGSICSSCREVCPEDAILFSAMLNPVILEDKCSGCHACIPVCPSLALSKGNHGEICSNETTDSCEPNLTGLDDLLGLEMYE